MTEYKYTQDYFQDYADFEDEDKNDLQPDPIEQEAKTEIKDFLNKSENQKSVFYSRQLQIIYERHFFHWVTTRALSSLVDEGEVINEQRELSEGGVIELYWHKSNRYYKKKAKKLVSLVEEYIKSSREGVGRYAELLVHHAFTKNGFIPKGEHTKKINNTEWTESEHDLDFIFERNGIQYGVEVKNTMSYISKQLFLTKLEICEYLNLKPLFIVRMLPKNWFMEVKQRGGYVMFLEYQVHPPSHRELTKRIGRELNLKLDCPESIQDGTMNRFLQWHNKQIS